MSNWENNSIQFPRLIAELEAAGAIHSGVIDALCESMDLAPNNIAELIDRAQAEWDNIKAKTYNN